MWIMRSEKELGILDEQSLCLWHSIPYFVIYTDLIYINNNIISMSLENGE